MRKRHKQIADPPKLFQLDKDCFYEIFEYLSLKDLHSFDQTCRQIMHGIEKISRKILQAITQHDKHGRCRSIHTPGFNEFMPCCLMFYI